MVNKIEYSEDKQKRIWKSGTFVYPIPAALVTSGTMEKSNVMTVAWTGILNSDPAIVYVSIRPQRYSYDLIKKNKEFVINLTTEDLVFQTDYCGVKTGAKVDKFKDMHLTKQKAKFVKCPLIKESPVSIECKVIDIKHYGSHDTFVGEVLSIDALDKYFDKNGAFDISKCKLVAYANGAYYSLGKKLGTFGYSVAKSNKKTVEKIKKGVIKNDKKITKKSMKKTPKKTSKKVQKNNEKVRKLVDM